MSYCIDNICFDKDSHNNFDQVSAKYYAIPWWDIPMDTF